jgi:hypothetical protein
LDPTWVEKDLLLSLKLRRFNLELQLRCQAKFNLLLCAASQNLSCADEAKSIENNFDFFASRSDNCD